MLTLHNISKYYAKEGNVALGLRKINLTLNRGEFIAVVGESGSGKSTLLNVISGLDSYEDGELLFNGEETSYYSKADWEAYRRDNVGFVFQDYHLIESFTVYQNVETALILAGAGKEERKKRALELIERVGLSAYKHTKVSKLSGGQMQRTVIARALAKDSPIIAADEPTGHLDAATGKQIIELLAEVSKDKLVIVVTHNFEELQHVATRKITIHDGAVVEDQKQRRQAAPTSGKVSSAASEETQTAEAATFASTSASEGRRMQPTRASRLQDLLLMSTRHLAAVPFKSVLMFLVLLLLSFGSAFGYGTMQDINEGLSLRSSSMFFANSSVERVIVNKADRSAFTPEERKELANFSQVVEVWEEDLALDQQLTVELPKRLSKNGTIVTSGIAPRSSLNESSLIEGRAPRSEDEIALNTRVLRKGIETEDVLDHTFDFTYGDSKYPLKVVGIADSKKVGEVAFVPESVLSAVSKEAALQYKTMSFAIGDTESITFTPQLEAAAKADKDGEAEPTAAVPAQKPLPPQTVDVSQTLATPYCSTHKAEGETCAELLSGSTLKIKVTGMYDSSESTFTIRDVIRDQQSGQAPVMYFSESDYRSVAQDQNPYQMSLMTDSDADSRELLAALRSDGYHAIYPHETLDPQTVFAPILKVIVIGIFLIGFIGVFILISYFILRTIVKSKRRDYVILRSIGASQKLVNRLMFTEMVLVSTVSLITAWIVSKICSWLPESSVTRAVSKMFAYFDWLDYVYLYLILLLIVLGLTSHMRKKLFSESVMSAYKGEEGSPT
ncbi:hypothetical protein PCCS19_07710 [Paenibacillus sp. CCS19]|uniref:ABC transporter ATP-binding protein/permease n=1 Tax=Paenibacillus sp. CCS19 TaxID=3158387 RepID=UPI002565C45C|nr:ATP-binding cassette domain-containing protein [Paenibacillus cellulosilyticus]GMK37717.1 hypothetical protein PCCS19_07710 [Paenibacillus cellulosilyticus]